VTSKSDALFLAAKLNVLFACSITIVLLAIEMIIHFSGNNLFRERHNAIVTVLHLLGIILYSQFTFASWNYFNLWYLFLVCRYPTINAACCHFSWKYSRR
jgi:hypothetical protein